ncbi:MAG: diaminohydroxyphosphoribosylaminopyrimidine deaminase [Planctomycetota bacterium]|jgi:diaminohydroxyphosphoribosylaminopyrimidine deaminase/5-amino-6-(5-phosphoribosylamino)uracil reductase
MSNLIDTLDEALYATLLEELSKEASRHRFEAAPNPCVGAALLSGGQVMARGFHRHWGGPHAEVAAFEAAEAAGVSIADCDSLVITLEPCSSQGKTPPCVDLILKHGIRSVVVGGLDPDYRHRGKGLEQLEAAGVEVFLVPGASPLEKTTPHFLVWTSNERVRRPRPWTILKWAQTLSGHLSPPEDIGGGRWISGPESLMEVQKLRSRVDAVVTGVGTILSDNPRLSLRDASFGAKAPMRVILDSSLRTPPDARLLQECGPGELGGEVHILAQLAADGGRTRALREAGAHVHGIRGEDKLHLDLRTVQTWLWDQGVRRAMVEAGPTLLSHYMDNGFADQIRVVTGSVCGGRGEALGAKLAGLRMVGRLDRECGEDAVFEAFVETLGN